VPDRSDLAFRLRQMTAADIPAGLELCRAARWNQIDADWRRYLALNPAGARVAVEPDDEVIGSVTTLRYKGGFAWLAMVLVSPDHRRQGIASSLVEEAIELLGAQTPVRLDATPAGELVYRKLGFEPEYALARMERLADDTGTASVEAGVCAMKDENLAEVLALDREVFGADRASLLRMLRDDAPGYAILLRSASGIEGYAFGRHGFTFDQLGPIVARDEGVARRLVRHLVASHPGVAFLIDAPRQSNTWTAWLGEMGFREQRGFVRMVRGGSPSRCDARVFATIGADFG
jgi:GNAT superfamily N-acetyltransferase